MVHLVCSSHGETTTILTYLGIHYSEGISEIIKKLVAEHLACFLISVVPDAHDTQKDFTQVNSTEASFSDSVCIAALTCAQEVNLVRKYKCTIKVKHDRMERVIFNCVLSVVPIEIE